MQGAPSPVRGNAPGAHTEGVSMRIYGGEEPLRWTLLPRGLKGTLPSSKTQLSHETFKLFTALNVIALTHKKTTCVWITDICLKLQFITWSAGAAETHKRRTQGSGTDSSSSSCAACRRECPGFYTNNQGSTGLSSQDFSTSQPLKNDQPHQKFWGLLGLSWRT